MNRRRTPVLQDLAPVLRHISPYLCVAEAVSVFCADKGMLALAERAGAPLDCWSQAWTLKQLRALLKRFMILDGAVNLVDGADAAVAARALPVGGLRHLAAGSLPYETPVAVAVGVPSPPPRLADWLPADCRPYLRTLHLGGCRTAVDLEVLRSCAQLRGLTVRRVAGGPDGVVDLAPLGACAKLEHVAIGGVAVDDRGGGAARLARGVLSLAPLARCGNLRHLSLPAKPARALGGAADPPVDCGAVLDLPLAHLEWVEDPAALDAASGVRAAHGALRHVGVQFALVERLHFAATLPNLRSLHLKAVKLQGAAPLAALAACDALERVSLEAVTGLGDLGALAGVPRLAALVVDVEPGGAAKPSLAPLAACPVLARLTVKGYRNRVASELFLPPPAFPALDALAISGLGFTAFANAAATSGAFPELREYNGAAAAEVRRYETARVIVHNQRYQTSYARLREGGLGPRAAMAAAGASVGDLIVPTCSPRSQRSSPDRPDPPPILPKFEG